MEGALILGCRARFRDGFFARARDAGPLFSTGVGTTVAEAALIPVQVVPALICGCGLPFAYAIGRRSVGRGPVDAIDAAGLAAALIVGAWAFRSYGAAVAIVAMAASACAISDVRFGYIFDAVLAAAGTTIAISGAIDGEGARIVPASIACFAVVAILSATFRGSIGAGDVKYSAILGGLGIASGLESIALAFACGGAVAAILMVAGKARRDSSLPFAPFLAVGVLASLTIGRTWGL